MCMWTENERESERVNILDMGVKKVLQVHVDL